MVAAVLKEQLRVGGRLVIPVGNKMQQRVQVIQRTAEGFTAEEFEECRFVPLYGKYGWADS